MAIREQLLDWLYEITVVGSYSKLGYRHRAKRFNTLVREPSLKKKTVIVTGANSGIGLAATEQLLECGVAVVMACRNRERSFEVYSELLAKYPSASLDLQIVDVSDLKSVVAFCNWLEATTGSVDGLLHNAGVLMDRFEETELGHELTLATHVLGPFLMTLRLQRLLQSGTGRVVFVSSGGMYTQELNLDVLVRPAQPFDGVRVYAQAKRAQIELTKLLAEFFQGSKITVNSMHPGWADTPGVEKSLPLFHKTLKSILRTPSEGADTAVWLCLSRDAAKFNGKFFLDRKPRKTHVFPWTKGDTSYRERLWPLLMELLREAGLDQAVAQSFVPSSERARSLNR